MPENQMTTTERLVQLLEQRAEAGLKKYGVTVARTDLKLADWVRHAQEEQLDAAQYLQRVLEVFQGEIESAYAEGYKDCSAALNETVHAVRAAMQHDWNQSRSKRVARS